MFYYLAFIYDKTVSFIAPKEMYSREKVLLYKVFTAEAFKTETLERQEILDAFS